MRAEFLAEQLKASIVNKYVRSNARVMSNLIDEAELTIRSCGRSYLVRFLQNIRRKTQEARNETVTLFYYYYQKQALRHIASRHSPRVPWRILNLPRGVAAIDLKSRGRLLLSHLRTATTPDPRCRTRVETRTR